LSERKVDWSPHQRRNRTLQGLTLLLAGMLGWWPLAWFAASLQLHGLGIGVGLGIGAFTALRMPFRAMGQTELYRSAARRWGAARVDARIDQGWTALAVMGLVQVASHTMGKVTRLIHYDDHITELVTPFDALSGTTGLLVALPILIAGSGQLFQGGFSRLTRARQVRLFVMAASGVVGLGVALLTPAELARQELGWPAGVPSFAANGLVLAYLLGTVRNLWPDLPTAGPLPRLRPGTESARLDLHTTGPSGAERMARLSTLTLGLIAAALALSLTPFASELAWLEDGLKSVAVLVMADGLLAAAGRANRRTVLQITPTDAVVEERSWFGTRRRRVDGVDLRLDVDSDPAGTLLRVGGGITVATDLSPDALDAVLTPLRDQLQRDTIALRDQARAALGRSTNAPAPATGIETGRLWHARLASIVFTVATAALGLADFPSTAQAVAIVAPWAIAASLALSRLWRLRRAAEPGSDRGRAVLQSRQVDEQTQPEPAPASQAAQAAQNRPVQRVQP